MSNCPICGSVGVAERELCDDRYGYPGTFTLLRCGDCGHRHLQTAFTEETIVPLYTDYYPRGSGPAEACSVCASQPATGWRAWWSGARCGAQYWVDPGSRVLDIGCGFGESLRYLESIGCDAEGIEADRNVAHRASRLGLKIRLGVFDAADYAADSFDCVIMNQVVEHLLDPVQALRDVARVLKPGGCLVLSTPNPEGWGAKVFGQRWINWHAPYHVNHFSRHSLSRVAAQTGFTVLETTTVTAADWLLYQWSHLASFPPPGRRSVFWSPGLTRSLPQRVLLRALHELHKTGINHALTRLFDGLGVGDNRICRLRKTA